MAKYCYGRKIQKIKILMYAQNQVVQQPDWNRLVGPRREKTPTEMLQYPSEIAACHPAYIEDKYLNTKTM